MREIRVTLDRYDFPIPSDKHFGIDTGSLPANVVKLANAIDIIAPFQMPVRAAYQKTKKS